METYNIKNKYANELKEHYESLSLQKLSLIYFEKQQEHLRLIKEKVEIQQKIDSLIDRNRERMNFIYRILENKHNKHN